MSMNPKDPLFNHIVVFEVSKAHLVVHTLPADSQHHSRHAQSGSPPAQGRTARQRQTGHRPLAGGV